MRGASILWSVVYDTEDYNFRRTRYLETISIAAVSRNDKRKGRRGIRPRNGKTLTVNIYNC